MAISRLLAMEDARAYKQIFTHAREEKCENLTNPGHLDANAANLRPILLGSGIRDCFYSCHLVPGRQHLAGAKLISPHFYLNETDSFFQR